MSTTRETTPNNHDQNGHAAHADIVDFIRTTDRFGPKKLTVRKAARGLASLLPRHGEPSLLWGTMDVGLQTESLIRLLDGLRSKVTPSEPENWNEVVTQWLDSPIGSRSYDELALESLAWAYALPVLTKRLSNAKWRQLLVRLVNVMADAQSEVTKQLDALPQQLLQAELPLALAYLFPELPTRRDWHLEGAAAVNAGVEALLDGAGMVHASHLKCQHTLFACWTRSLYVDRQFKKRRINKGSRLQYDWMVREVSRWTRPDGAGFFSHGPTSDAVMVRHRDLLRAAAEISGDAAHLALDKAIWSEKKRNAAERKLPDPSERSEWGELAVLRAKWSHHTEALAVSFSDGNLMSELVVGQRVIWSGRHMPIVTIDGERQQPISGWQETCWEQDADVAYLELEVEFGGDWRLQRQIMLGREDGILLVADAILGTRRGAIEYCQPLPLAPNVRLALTGETNEAYLTDVTRCGAVLPLSLPEWRAATRNGELAAGPAELRQQAIGNAMYAAVFVDLRPTRCDERLTWRHLTVAENLSIIPADQAVAYRVQVGDDQWVFYRSLTPPGNRTFIGVNTVSEFVAARLTSTGDAETLIDIAGPEADQPPA